MELKYKGVKTFRGFIFRSENPFGVEQPPHHPNISVNNHWCHGHTHKSNNSMVQLSYRSIDPN